MADVIPQGADAGDFFVARPKSYRRRRNMGRELDNARALHAELCHAVAAVMEQATQGRPVDPGHIRRAARRLIASLLRNPDAALWVARLRDRDDYLHQRAVRCAIWAIAFGRHLGLPKKQLEQLALGVLLCEIGYTQLPDEVVTKAGPPSADELELLKEHVALGQEILEDSGTVDAEVVAIVGAHHERRDGSGYPLGLAGNDIPPLARIAGVVDVYDALTASRPQGLPLEPAKAMEALHRMRDREFSAGLIEQFILAIGIYPAGTLVELSTGEIALVTEQSPERRLKPRVLLVLDSAKRRLDGGARDTDVSSLETERGRPVSIRKALPKGAYGIDLRDFRPAPRGPVARLQAWRQRLIAR